MRYYPATDTVKSLPPVQSNLATCQIQRSAAARRFRSEQTGSKVRIARQPPGAISAISENLAASRQVGSCHAENSLNLTCVSLSTRMKGLSRHRAGGQYPSSGSVSDDDKRDRRS